LLICQGLVVGIYLSDVFGAFDHVILDQVLGRLRFLGLSESYINFFHSFLKPRRAVVVCDGAFSRSFQIKDMLFQGTVLGPPLWNTFFGPVQDVTSVDSFEPAVFGDDLNVFKGYPTGTLSEDIYADLHYIE